MGLHDKLQNLFPINGNSFQRKPKLIAIPYILQWYRFIFETTFISEQIAETDLELCYRLVTNLSPSLMFLAIWFCSSGLKQFGKFQNHTACLQRQWLGSFV